MSKVTVVKDDYCTLHQPRTIDLLIFVSKKPAFLYEKGNNLVMKHTVFFLVHTPINNRRYS